MPTFYNRQVLLAKRPIGEVLSSDFTHTSCTINTATLGSNQIVVRNDYLSLDPAMRGWMNDAKSYIASVQLGSVMRGTTIGQVVFSNDPKYKIGDHVIGMIGWQDYSVTDAKEISPLPPLPPSVPLTACLSVLGGTGLTAYFGLIDIGDIGKRKNETVLVSGAAGAVGSIVGQIAKIKGGEGTRVIGICGDDSKANWLINDLGFDGVVNYKTTGAENLYKELRALCPNGVDIYFDNVGDHILNTALRLLTVGARVVLCGAISQYNSTQPIVGPSNYLSLLVNRAKMEGFVVLDYRKRFREGAMQLAQWIVDGKLKYKEHVVDDLVKSPEHLKLLFNGVNSGKLIVRLRPDSNDKSTVQSKL